MIMVYLPVALAAIAGLGWLAWRYFGSGRGALFGNGREARIGVSEVASIDGKRKLLLIHRDGVEHLVMTGGPIDVVIEHGIHPPRKPVAIQAGAMPAPYEPRLGGQSLPASPHDTNPDPSPGFGRLRQRGAPAATSEAHPRAETTGLAAGGNGR